MPVFAAIPAIIGAVSGVAGVVGGVKASKNASKQTDILQQQVSQQQQLIDEQKLGAQQARQYANDFMPMAKKNLTQVNDYWLKMFGGDRNAINEALAPEMNNYLAGTANAERNLAQFANRGNIGDRLIGLNFTKAANLAGARVNQKNASVGKLQDIGTLFGNLGLSSLASASGQTTSAMQGIQGNQQVTMGLLNRADQQSSSMGASLGQLVNAFNWKASSLGEFFGMPKSSGNMSMSDFNSISGMFK